MASALRLAIAFVLASAVAQANKCSDGSECLSNEGFTNAVSLLQTNIHLGEMQAGHAMRRGQEFQHVLRAEGEAKQVALRAEKQSAFAVDFVYCWAGNDVEEGMTKPPDPSHSLGLGFGELKWSIKYLEAHAPWLNKIYVLVNTPTKRPAWLTENSTDKIVMIDRCTLFARAQDCPTKNKDACSAVMHKIPGLSEHFVYMDDDWLVLEPVEVSDFFTSQGQPLVLAKGAYPAERDLYSDTGDEYGLISGPDIPPKHRPTKMMGYIHHVPLPGTKSFALWLEGNYSDWYAFVRSHHTRFVCCDASKLGNGLDECFQRIYPHMLLKWKVGVKSEVPYDAICRGPGSHGYLWGTAFLQCMTEKIQNPMHYKFMALQNIEDAADWAAIQKAMEAQLANAPVSRFVVDLTHVSEGTA